ncbi:hypothetical protein [Ferdinandcohnia sp. Marseille-Q9671]
MLRDSKVNAKGHMERNKKDSTKHLKKAPDPHGRDGYQLDSDTEKDT